MYNAPDSTSHHIYMSLIVLLILSEDDNFNKSVHLTVRYCTRCDLQHKLYGSGYALACLDAEERHLVHGTLDQ